MREIKIVVGANYGDEGKGLCTDALVRKAVSEKKTVLNVLFNGGPQRAHTVEYPGLSRHVFHHFGAGTIAGADTYFDPGFMMNPMVFTKERNALLPFLFRQRNLRKVYVHKNCRVITPFDMMANQIIELGRSEKHGTCGHGIWETVVRQRDPEYAFLWKDAKKNDCELRQTLKNIRNYYTEKRGLVIPGEYEIPWNSENLITHFIGDIRQMLGNTIIVSDMPQSYDTVVFEAGQGLAIDFDADPIFATPSRTGSRDLIPMLSSTDDIEVIYVTRTYFTRHGAGPFPTEVSRIVLNDKTNITNGWQGELRYGKFSADEMLARIEKDAVPGIKKSLLITHTNEEEIPAAEMSSLSGYFDSIYTSGDPHTVNFSQI